MTQTGLPSAPVLAWPGTLYLAPPDLGAGPHPTMPALPGAVTEHTLDAPEVPR